MNIEENTVEIIEFFGLCPPSGILKNTTFRKLVLLPSSGERMRDTYSVGSVRES
jgi:hypothetical protein